MDFTALQGHLSASQLLAASPDEVFPLLCPTREYDWIETWKCRMLFSKSGCAELDCVFQTNFPGDENETWIVDRYEPNRLIQFVRFTEIRVIRYSISLEDNGDGTTLARWEQTLTSLNLAGNRSISELSESDFIKRIKALENMLNHYLTTGKMLQNKQT